MTTTLVKPTALAAGTYWTEKARYSRTGWTTSMLPAESGDSIGVNPSQLPIPEPGGWNLAGGSRATESGGTWVESASITRTISGLTIGATYRIAVDVIPPVNRLIRVTAGGKSREYAGRLTTTPASIWTAYAGDSQTDYEERHVEIEWEATAASTTLKIEIVRLPVVTAPIELAPAVTPYDVMTDAAIMFRDVVLSERHDSDTPLEITDARVTMDATWSPYIQAPVTCRLPDASVLDRLDPLAETRVIVTGSDLESGTDRTWNLSLRSTEEDAAADTVLLTLESDEAVAREFTPAFDDRTPFDRSADLREVVEYVVSTAVPGAAVVGPAAAIDVRPRWEATNLIENPDFMASDLSNLVADADFRSEISDGVWALEPTSSTMSIVSMPEGRSLLVLVASGQRTVAYNTVEIPVQQGERYKLAATVRAIGGPMRVFAGAVNETSWIAGLGDMDFAADGAWNRQQTEITVPAGATRLRLYFQASTDSPPAGQGWLREPEIVRLSTGTNSSVVSRWLPSRGPVERVSSGALRHTVLAGGEQQVIALGHRVTPGRSYYARVGVRRSGTRRIRVGIRFRDRDGNVIPTSTAVWTSGFTVVSNGTWVTCEVSAVAPADAVTADFGVLWSDSAFGEVCEVDSPLFAESDFPLPYFDGSRADDADYTYHWDGTPNASSSTRRPLAPRPPEALIWTPGTSAWAFLEQLLYASGYRLWCDEDRVWHLTPDDAPGTTGAIAVTEATDARGTSSRDDDAYANTIIITYRWTDRYGYPWSETVVAGRGGPTKAYTFDDTPYPGGNPAERILAAAQVAGRTRTVTAPVDYTATPGMTLDLTLPGKAPATGTIRRVDFDLATGLMTIEAHKIQET